jgi:hypothetical protein
MVRSDKTGFEPRLDARDAGPSAASPSHEQLFLELANRVESLRAVQREALRQGPAPLRLPPRPRRQVVKSLLFRNDPSHVLKKHEEMHRVRRGGDEIEFQVRAPRFFVLRMHRERAYAGNIGRLQRAQHRVL